MNIHTIYGWFQPYFRRRRAQLFHTLMPVTPGQTILDVGGYHTFWTYMDCDNPVECLNVHEPRFKQPLPERFKYVVGDGRALPYPNGHFELAFSNSVIEHVGGWEDQQRFAAEIRRVGRSYWVQTPNRWFPVEPHLIGAFVHFLPFRLQRRLVRWLTVWGWVNKPSQQQIDDFISDIRLLTEREMRTLFPDAEIHYERVLFFFKKSFIAVRAVPQARGVAQAAGEQVPA